LFRTPQTSGYPLRISLTQVKIEKKLNQLKAGRPFKATTATINQ